MKTFKKVLAMLIAVLAIATISGCENSNDVDNKGKRPTISILEPSFYSDRMLLEAIIMPSTDTEKVYYKCETEGETLEYNVQEGAEPVDVQVDVEYGKTYTITAYAENKAGKSDVATYEYTVVTDKEVTIAVSDITINAETSKAEVTVTPSEIVTKWYYKGYFSDAATEVEWTEVEGNETKTLSFDYEPGRTLTVVVYGVCGDKKSEEVSHSFLKIKDVASIIIQNLTSYSVDAVVTKADHCVKYVCGAVHSAAYDEADFVEQAQRSLNPDTNTSFMPFNTALDSRTFSEQDLVRNSLSTNAESAGLLITAGTSYTVAVYGEDKDGNYNVVTEEFTAPAPELNGNLEISISLEEITETSATAKITAAESCKVLFGLIDPEIAKANSENGLDFDTATDAEIKAYILKEEGSLPTIYTEPFTTTLSDILAVGKEYVAYAIAIKEGKVGEVDYEKFSTETPTLTGIAKITDAEILDQTSADKLRINIITDDNAKKVRLYAAPATDHAANKDNLIYILDAEDYQNYREEFEVKDGVASAMVEIYHPGDNYYIYASAVDSDGKAGEMVCVATLSGLDTEYYTTMVEEVNQFVFDGTATVDMTVSVISETEDQISVSINTDKRSTNADKVYLIRLGDDKVSNINNRLQTTFAEYPNRIIGAYKIGEVGTEVRYENIGTGFGFNDKFEALNKYDMSAGGDIIVAVVLDTDGKLNIHSYYAAGKSVELF